MSAGRHFPIQMRNFHALCAWNLLFSRVLLMGLCLAVFLFSISQQICFLWGPVRPRASESAPIIPS